MKYKIKTTLKSSYHQFDFEAIAKSYSKYNYKMATVGYSRT